MENTIQAVPDHQKPRLFIVALLFAVILFFMLYFVVQSMQVLEMCHTSQTITNEQFISVKLTEIEILLSAETTEQLEKSRVSLQQLIEDIPESWRSIKTTQINLIIKTS